MGYLNTLIINLDESFFHLENQMVKELIKQMFKEFDGKRIKMKKGAEAVFLEIKKKIGSDLGEKLV